MKKFVASFIVIFISSLLWGCVSEKNEPSANGAEKKRKAVAEVNGRTLYEDEFFDFSRTVLKEMDASSLDNTVIKNQLVKDFIEHNMLVDEASRRGVSIDDERIDSVLQSFSTEKGAQDLRVYSGSYDTDHEKLARLLRQRLLVETLLNSVVSPRITIIEKDMKDYYASHPEVSSPESKAHIMHIFTTTEEKASKAMGELKKGLSFNEVAERYSEGPEKNAGGDLGFVSDKDFPEIFEQAFKLPVGRLSDIIKSDYGYHIFLVKAVDKPRQVRYEDVKSKIYFELYSKAQEEKTREFIDELYEKSDIRYFSDVDLRTFLSGGAG